MANILALESSVAGDNPAPKIVFEIVKRLIDARVNTATVNRHLGVAPIPHPKLVGVKAVLRLLLDFIIKGVVFVPVEKIGFGAEAREAALIIAKVKFAAAVKQGHADLAWRFARRSQS